MKRRNIILFLIISLIMHLNVIIYAKTNNDLIKIKINDEFLTLEKNPIVENGRVLLPFRIISERMGFFVDWNSDTKTIICTKDNNKISLTIGDVNAEVDGVLKSIDVPAKIIDETTFVPIRFIAENFGAKVNWEDNTKIIEIIFNNNIYNEFDDVLEEMTEVKTEILNSNNNRYKVFDENNNVLISLKVNGFYDMPEVVDALVWAKSNRYEEREDMTRLNMNYYIIRQKAAQEIINSKMISAKSFLNEFIRIKGYKNLDELKREVKYHQENDENFKPMEIIVSYDANIFDNFVSLKKYCEITSSYTNFNAIFSDCYSIETGKEVSLDNISKKLFEKDSTYVLENVKDIFIRRIKEKPEEFFKNAEELVESLDDKNFYFSSRGINFFFNQGIISNNIEEAILFFVSHYRGSDTCF